MDWTKPVRYPFPLARNVFVQSPLADYLDAVCAPCCSPLQLRYGDISFHFAKFCHPDIPARSAYALHLALPMSYWGDV